MNRMKHCPAQSNVAFSLLLLLLAVSLSTACKSSTNTNTSNSDGSNTSSSSSSSTTATSTTTVNTNKATTNTEAPASTPAATGAAALHTPPDGSPERKAILDAVREYLRVKQDFVDAVFDDVETLNVHQGWAYIATDVSAPDNSPYGLVEALLQEQSGRWRVVEVFEYDGSNEQAQWEAFKSRYTSAPKDIFPPRQ
jgi:hypothetical protein